MRFWLKEYFIKSRLKDLELSYIKIGRDRLDGFLFVTLVSKHFEGVSQVKRMKLLSARLEKHIDEYPIIIQPYTPEEYVHIMDPCV